MGALPPNPRQKIEYYLYLPQQSVTGYKQQKTLLTIKSVTYVCKLSVTYVSNRTWECMHTYIRARSGRFNHRLLSNEGMVFT
jgi:hypothetical protein